MLINFLNSFTTTSRCERLNIHFLLSASRCDRLSHNHYITYTLLLLECLQPYKAFKPVNLQTLSFHLVNDTLTSMYILDRKQILKWIACLWKSNAFLIRTSPKLIPKRMSKGLKSIKYWCNQYNNFFVNNHYSHVIIGGLNIIINKLINKIIKLHQLIFKGPKYWQHKQINFEGAREEIQTGIDQFIGRISNEKRHLQEQLFRKEYHVMSSVVENIHILLNKVTFISVNMKFGGSRGWNFQNMIFHHLKCKCRKHLSLTVFKENSFFILFLVTFCFDQGLGREKDENCAESFAFYCIFSWRWRSVMFQLLY